MRVKNHQMTIEQEKKHIRVRGGNDKCAIIVIAINTLKAQSQV